MNSLNDPCGHPSWATRTKWLWTSLLLCAAVTLAQAHPGVISASVKETKGKGHARVGDRIEVVVEIHGYTDAPAVGGFNVQVAYDATLFTPVDGSFSLGRETGRDQQWLTKRNARSGQSLALFVEGSQPGLLTVSVADLSPIALPGGTTAKSGFLFSFELEAIGAGTGEIMAIPFPDGSALFDSGLSRSGDPSFANERKVKVRNAK